MLLHAGWGILIIVVACVAGLVLIGFLYMLLVQQHRSSRAGSFARYVVICVKASGGKVMSITYLQFTCSPAVVVMHVHSAVISLHSSAEAE